MARLEPWQYWFMNKYHLDLAIHNHKPEVFNLFLSTCAVFKSQTDF